MNITGGVASAVWADAERRFIAAMIDGAMLRVPDDPENTHRRAIAAWQERGNMIGEPAVSPLADIKTAALAKLAARRWRAETSGTSVDGQRLSSDERAQAKLAAALMASVLDNSYRVQWKLADGAFVHFDHAKLISASLAVRAHVQACFDHEAELAARIVGAADASAVAAIDIEAGWPG